MQSSLNILLTFYSVLLLVNIVVSAALWRATGEKLYRTMVIIWSGSLVNFVLQGVFTEHGIPMLLSFSTCAFVSLCLMKFVNQNFDTKIPIKKWSFAVSVLIAFACLVQYETGNYTLSSLIAAVAISLPQFCAALKVAWVDTDRRVANQLLTVVLTLNAVHFLDYPLLRSIPSGALWGFSIAFFLLVMMSTFMPAFIVKQLSMRYEHELEEKVRMRTQEFKVLSDQNSALVSMVCHDLATPLTVLQVASSFITEKTVTDLTSQDLEKSKTKIKKSMDAIKEILSNVRSLQQIRVGKEALSLGVYKPEELLNEVIAMYEDSLKAKNLVVRIENHLRPKTHFKYDYKLMKNEVIANLLSNAIKFSNPGSEIIIVLKEDDRHGVVEVIDRGIGIPDEILPHLFDFSAKTSRLGTQNEKGTGFGLPLVKASLQLMGANISVSSQTRASDGPTGTCFKLELKKVA